MLHDASRYCETFWHLREDRGASIGDQEASQRRFVVEKRATWASKDLNAVGYKSVCSVNLLVRCPHVQHK